MLIKGEEGAEGTQLLQTEGQEREEEEVEVRNQERILSGSRSELKYN